MLKGLLSVLGLIIIIYMVLLFPKIESDLVLLFRIILYGAILAVLIIIALGGMVAREKFLTIQAQRKQEQARSKAALYTTYQDGFGMTHLHNLQTGIVENLSTYPGSHHNGHWEEPPQSAMLAWFALVSKSKDINKEVLQLPATVENVPELMTILEKAERVLVKGPSDSGKTTLFVNIASRLDNVIVIDPHYAPGIWPEHCKIIGKGRNHQEITLFLNWLSEELNKRYELRANGKEDYPTLSIIIDEWMSISSRCENATEVITELITEARKAKIRIFIGSHSDQVEALGIKGQGKLREGLIIVRLYFDQITHERSATYDYGRGERACLVPGSAPVVSKGNSFELPELREPDLIIDKKLSERQLKILELIKQGLSDNEIALEVFKKSRLVGSHFYEVKEMRDLSATYT